MYRIEALHLEENKIIAKAPIAISPTQDKVAVVVHLFYPDIWEEIQAYLQKLEINFDLFISVPPHISEQEIRIVWDAMPTAHIYRTENRGRDVLPFLQIMHIIGTDTYQYICKIHTKKTGESDLGFVWRKLLYYDLIGSNEVVNDTLSLLDNDSTIGMVSGKNTILDSQRYTYGNAANVKYLSHQSGIVHEDFYLFPAGTMFWTRAEIIAPMVKLLEEDKLDFAPEAGQIDNTIAHAIERFFGIIAHDKGYKIVESPAKYSHLSDETLDNVASLVLSQQYVGNNVFALQKQKLEEQNQFISYLEQLTIATRLKNKVKPPLKKLIKVPKLGMKVLKTLKSNPQLLKKVFYYAKRGELGYLITKIIEKSSQNLSSTQDLVEVNKDSYFTLWHEKNYAYTGTKPIDIIIPVYNGYEFLEALFDSVEKHTSIPYRLIVINDCSPDSHVKPYLLERLSKHPTAIFIDHTANQGFLKSVNEAYTHVQNHFVLLNTDTEVPSFWLERLMYPILSMDNIASTTPFTNSGEIASFPNFVADNPIFDSMSVEELDATFKTINPEDFYAEVPTGVGFCMGVNYTLAQKIGLFAEDTFGKGYGEENDWCQRGELGYLITKIIEKSSQNLSSTQDLVEVNKDSYFTLWHEKNYAYTGTKPIDIIIPVYNGYEFLEALFDSVEKHTSIPYRLIVINDCSPDSHVKPYLLERLSKHPTAIFIDHTANQGFLKSVNEAYTHVQNHFVLLNTDTEVPSFWLERLMYPILSMDNIASTTPFTNSGEIASFPNFVADNPIFDSMSVEELDATFKTINPEDFYAEVPTGVGFCMGVNYTLAQKIGLFAEDTFGKGYGEENDWCQRAIKEGYKNLIVPNLFVYHKHGGSFSAEEKQKLLEKNAITLLERHPNYGKDVNTYIEQNPHETLRHLLVLRASNTTHPIHLMFDHSLGGGANHYADERLEKYLSEEKNILLVKYDFYSACYTLRHRYKQYDFSFKITEFELLTAFIDTLDITELFINNLVSYKTPKKILTYLTHLAENKNIHTIVPIHDMYMICPSYNLLNEKGHYCDVPSLETCKTCMLSNMQEWRNFYEEEVDIKAWREIWGNLLEKSTEILCFSNSSKEIFQKAYPNIEEAKLQVIPHTVEGISPVIVQKETNKTTKTIGVLGAINYVKGASIIKQMVEIIDRDNLDINIVVIGEITEPIKSKYFHTTGRYNRDDLPQIIQEHQIDIFLIPSVWPETFSYTTQEIMMMELPLMVFDLGAPAERVSQYSKGYIINEVSATAVLQKITEIS